MTDRPASRRVLKLASAPGVSQVFAVFESAGIQHPGPPLRVRSAGLPRRAGKLNDFTPSRFAASSPTMKFRLRILSLRECSITSWSAAAPCRAALNRSGLRLISRQLLDRAKDDTASQRMPDELHLQTRARHPATLRTKLAPVRTYGGIPSEASTWKSWRLHRVFSCRTLMVRTASSAKPSGRALMPRGVRCNSRYGYGRPDGP